MFSFSYQTSPFLFFPSSVEIPDLSLATKLTVTLLTSITFIVSCIGNSLVIHVIRKNRLLKSTTYLLILNMACGDLLATVLVCPSLIKFLFIGIVWLSGKFGSVLCKMNLYVALVALLGCIFSLVGITIDRYLAVTRPLKHKPWTKWTKIIIPTIWFTAILLPLKIWDEIGIVGKDSGNTVCINGQSSIGLMIIMATCFLLPFTVMLVLYPIICYRLWTRRIPGEVNALHQQRTNLMARKVTKMMIAVVLSFFVCWAPQCGFIWIHPYATDLVGSLPYELIPFTIWLEVLNCALNPVLYAIFNESFRKAFKEIMFSSASREHNFQIPHFAINQDTQKPTQNIALVKFHTNLGVEN